MSFIYTSIFRLGIEEQKSDSSSADVYASGTSYNSIINGSEKRFNCFGYSTEVEARAALIAYLQLNQFYNNLVPVSISLSETAALNVWEAVVKYAGLTREQLAINSGVLNALPLDYTIPPIGEDQISYSGGNESEHILFYEGGENWSFCPDGSAPTSYNGAIDYNNNQIGGFDRIAAAFDFNISFAVPKNYFVRNNQAKLLLYANLVGCTNNATWAGFSAGNVLFKSFETAPTYLERLDASTDRAHRKDYYLSVNLNFSVRRSTVWEDASGTQYTQAGFDYVWKHTGETIDAAAALAINYDQVTCGKVYPQADFTQFGLTFEDSLLP